MLQLETPRLLLRPFILDDADVFFELNNDPLVIQYTGDRPFYSIEEAEELIQNYQQYKLYNMGRLTMIIKETQEIIGWCGLKYHEENETVDLGFRLFKVHWNKGFATEASMACLKYGFEELNLQQIYARAMIVNEASIAVMKKVGMVYWKTEGDDVYYRINKYIIPN
jgi:RimJ/RimL family protein N-acetyltransferase